MLARCRAALCTGERQGTAGAALNLVKASLGAGSFSMPWAFGQSGLAGGVLGMIVFGVASVVTILQLGWVEARLWEVLPAGERAARTARKQRLSYPELAELAMPWASVPASSLGCHWLDTAAIVVCGPCCAWATRAFHRAEAALGLGAPRSTVVTTPSSSFSPSPSSSPVLVSVASAADLEKPGPSSAPPGTVTPPRDRHADDSLAAPHTPLVSAGRGARTLNFGSVGTTHHQPHDHDHDADADADAEDHHHHETDEHDHRASTTAGENGSLHHDTEDTHDSEFHSAAHGSMEFEAHMAGTHSLRRALPDLSSFGGARTSAARTLPTDDRSLTRGGSRINLVSLLASAGIVATSVGVGGVYVDFVTATLPTAFPVLTPWIAVLIMAPIVLFVTILGKLGWLAYTSAIGNIAVVSGVIAVIAAGLVNSGGQLPKPSASQEGFRPTFALFIGSVSFLFAVHIVALPIVQGMRTPDMRRAVGTSFAFITISNLLLGVIGLLLYGDSVSANVILNLGTGFELTIVRLLLVVDLIATMPVVLLAAATVIESAAARRCHGTPQAFVQIATRASLTMAAFGIAFIIPDFGRLVSIVGGFVSVGMGYTLPAILYAVVRRLRGELSVAEGISQALLAMAGLVVMVLTVVQAAA